MKCPEAMENLAAYLDGEVDGAPRRAMDAHFSVCETCTGERRAQAAVWRLLDLVEVPVGPASPAEFDAALAARVRTGGAPRGRLLGLPLPLAAAAALLLAAGGGALLLRGDGGTGTTDTADVRENFAGPTADSAGPPEALLDELSLLESLDLLQDDDLDVVDRLYDMGAEDLAVLGGG